jgi:sugar transferase EpsL
LDFWVATAALLIFAPLLAAVALTIWLSMGSPVLFRQIRSGYKGRPFTLLKFRTMRDSRDAHGRALPDAERLTALGRLLRRLSLDELPQLWNVWKGSMSLVGPRPLVVKYLERYTPEQARRHEVKPGITGWAQINGRNALTWNQKFCLDVWYVDHRSFWLDIRILLITTWQMLTSRGINQPGHATAEEFHGGGR